MDFLWIEPLRMQDDATQVECIGHVSLSHYEQGEGLEFPF